MKHWTYTPRWAAFNYEKPKMLRERCLAGRFVNDEDRPSVRGPMDLEVRFMLMWGGIVDDVWYERMGLYVEVR